MMGKYLAAVLLIGSLGCGMQLQAQCGGTNIVGNLVPNNGDTLSGTYTVSGNFIVGPGVTVYVRPYASGGCGALNVVAAGNIQIDGTIDATGAGYSGGGGGALGGANNISFIESCPSPTDQCGAVQTFGGSGGGSGNPGGGGIAGASGLNGGGRKNQCQNFGDVTGRVGGSGGAGAGAGASYGGAGTPGAPGGQGSVPSVSTADPTCTSQLVGFGFGGNGGNIGTIYGTLSGADIDLGSAGAGAGGGGRGRVSGTAGAAGGAGGGLVHLESGGDFIFTGNILADGRNGGAGGNGGNAGASPRCCSDLCDGVDEYTHTGAGGGGGGAGGGSGGGVLLRVGGIANITGTIHADGGDGGGGGTGGNSAPSLSLGGGFLCSTTTASTSGGSSAGSGGGGGGGRIKVFYNACAPGNNVLPTTTALGGNGNGGNAANGTSYLGTDGSFTLGTAQPGSQSICYLGDPGNLNSLPASGGYGGISYQWQASTGCTGIFANIASANTLNYDPPAGLTDTTCYRLQISSGTCTAYSDTLTVAVIPPQFASISPSGNIAACIGDSVLLQTSGGAGASYQWLYNGIPVPAAIDSFFQASVSGAYSVQVNYPVGCAGLSAATTIVFDPPPAAFVFVQGDTVLCPGEAMSLQGFGQGSFQWQLNQVDIAGATGNSLVVTQAGSYTLEVTTAGGCASVSAPMTISAGTAPNVSLLAGGPLAFCAGDSVQLTGQGGTVTGWLLNGLPLAAAAGNVLSVQNTGLYSAIVQNASGCSDTTNAFSVLSDTVIADLNPAVSPVACLGDSALFLATGGGSYAWLFDQQPIADTTNFLFAGTQGDYTVIVTSATGCVDTSLTYAFTYYPPIFPTASAQGSNFLCPGDTILLIGNAPGATGHQWLLNDTAVAGANGPVYNATTPGVYALQAFDNFGCHYESPYFSVFPGAEPVAEIIPLGSLPVCNGDSIMLLGRGGDSLWWYRDGNLIQAGTDTTLVASQSGIYMLVVRTGCGVDSSLALAVGVGAGPTAGFYGNNLPENEVEFVDQSISGARWLWDFGDGSPAVTDQNPHHVFPGPGSFSITMITWDIYGCSDTIRLDFEVVDPVFFIPNVFSPNEDGVNDQAFTNFNSMTSLEFKVYDRWGKSLFLTTSKTEYWDGTWKGKPVPDGVYYYHLTGKNAQDKEIQAKGNITLIR